jgi:chemotaxis family two-component system sensor kinase Cph1
MVITRTLVADGSAASRRLFAAATSITKASGRMGEMLADLLDLGSIEQGRFQVHPEPHVMQDLLDARALLMPIAEARHMTLRSIAPCPGR